MIYAHVRNVNRSQFFLFENKFQLLKEWLNANDIHQSFDEYFFVHIQHNFLLSEKQTYQFSLPNQEIIPYVYCVFELAKKYGIIEQFFMNISNETWDLAKNTYNNYEIDSYYDLLCEMHTKSLEYPIF